ncbi:lipid II:glycine glycyltransferase FemX [Maricaulis parjimensis]|uniref:lipid II:glycine glycyltransferase FemX n=1 Tax=Maricaulis parjimensis TaxID=144023 RepID=UPI001939D098|nr:GNAT family N-acetyltransferase [Maricaulis parjimensis]
MKLDPEIPRPVWDAALAQTPAALQQDWSYGEALRALGADVRRVGLIDDGALVGLAQFTTRRFGPVGVSLCTRGPVWLEDVPDATATEAYRRLKGAVNRAWPRVTLLTPDETVPAGVGRMKRVMTGYSTVLIDLSRSLEDLRGALDGKWRNRLNAAEKSAFKVQENSAKLAQFRWLLDTEEGQRAARGYRATPASLVPAFLEAKQDRNSVLILRADEGKTKIAAMMFLIHGCAATYHMGWANEAGRKTGAHNRLLWGALERLKARGVKQLDLGGVNTVSGAGIARFKLGIGGKLVTLGGTYF